ncbi:zinc-ribbon and DUF3426 domain-containing protein [Variovorax sp. Sphag1AA]|uniref:zinc-ribbon and DUF3426 domain-containing protein n=1 Tax=Variovorax sp. Sphag1AA TaxID=2587027 RepID=UPI00161D7327|nr:zinc-ribbon and DUF3426 domain-containing protein [Variovorax sp. Sphag1AA]MBB3177098.1 putative Zn finger-like uncharacterized protein [Variovorax sp. Sphag1AA]
MSLVTRCPACATPFKVVRDQLRISDGWVRCGRCSQVFDATVDLREAAEFHVETPAPPLPSALDAAVPDAVVEELPRDADTSVELSETPEPLAEAEQPNGDPVSVAVETDFFDDFHEALTIGRALPSSDPVQAPPVDAYDDDADRADTPVRESVPDMAWPDADMLSLGDEGRVAVRPPVPPPLSFPDIDLSLPSSPRAAAAATPAPALAAVPADAGSASDDLSNVQLQKALRRARAKSAKIAKARERKATSTDTAPVVLSASEPEPAIEPMPAELSQFFGAESDKGFWQRPVVRGVMALLAFLGVVLLLGQMAYQERDLIAARQPSLRPALQSMCSVLGCEVSALRQINDIKVDGASFAREKSDDGYRFSFTLRNGAEVPLAMPAVELSLLDTQERAVVRRVLMPAEFGAPNVLPARSERSASLLLRLTGPEVALMPPVAGFRVETLYP